jgi:tripartite-type tricarboxylate transporter receptor subunit TctC
MSLKRRDFILGSATIGAPFISPLTWAQGTRWPNKPVQFITPYPPGGLSDQITRFIADGVSREIGQTVIVINKAGAGATLGTEFAARSAPDGYNFLVAPTATVAIAPWLRKMNFSLDDFVPVAKLTSSYGLVTARKDTPWADYRDFVKAAKAAPGKFTFASNGVGTIVHLTGVLLHKQAGIDVVHVPYKGSVESMTDLIGGRVDVMYDPVTLPRIKEGSLKALVTTNPQRNPEIPDVPTLKELGMDLDSRSWFAMFAPKGTSAEIVSRMSEAAQKVMGGAGVREKLVISAMYPDYENYTTFAKTVRQDSAFFHEIIDKEQIKGD